MKQRDMKRKEKTVDKKVRMISCRNEIHALWKTRSQMNVSVGSTSLLYSDVFTSTCFIVLTSEVLICLGERGHVTSRHGPHMPTLPKHTHTLPRTTTKL